MSYDANAKPPTEESVRATQDLEIQAMYIESAARVLHHLVFTECPAGSRRSAALSHIDAALNQAKIAFLDSPE